jgi:hypothetical protein
MVGDAVRADGRGRQPFFLVELIPFLVAVLVSWVISGNGVFSARSLLWWGGGAILGSYVHFFVVGICYLLYDRAKRGRWR